MKRSFCALGLILSVGCATAVVRPYVGEQQNWPTATGSIVNTRYDMPIFTSLPSAPYDILAEMRIQSPLYAQPEEGHLPVLVKKAKQIGADALVFVEGQVYFAANYGSRVSAPEPGGQTPTLTQVNRFNPESFKPGVTIIAIKWTGEPPPGLAAKKEMAEEKKEEPAPEAPAAPPTPEIAPAPPAPEVVTPPATLEPAPAPEMTPAPTSELAPAAAPESATSATNEPPTAPAEATPSPIAPEPPQAPEVPRAEEPAAPAPAEPAPANP